MYKSPTVRRLILRDVAWHGDRLSADRALETIDEGIDCAILADLCAADWQITPLDPLPARSPSHGGRKRPSFPSRTRRDRAHSASIDQNPARRQSRANDRRPWLSGAHHPRRYRRGESSATAGPGSTPAAVPVPSGRGAEVKLVAPRSPRSGLGRRRRARCLQLSTDSSALRKRMLLNRDHLPTCVSACVAL